MPLAEPTPTPAPMASFLSNMTTSFPTILDAVVDACSTIVGSPFLLFTCIFLFAGGVVGILGRLLSRN